MDTTPISNLTLTDTITNVIAEAKTAPSLWITLALATCIVGACAVKSLCGRVQPKPIDPVQEALNRKQGEAFESCLENLKSRDPATYQAGLASLTTLVYSFYRPACLHARTLVAQKDERADVWRCDPEAAVWEKGPATEVLACRMIFALMLNRDLRFGEQPEEVQMAHKVFYYTSYKDELRHTTRDLQALVRQQQGVACAFARMIVSEWGTDRKPNELFVCSSLREALGEAHQAPSAS